MIAMSVDVGDKAPGFTIQADDGRTVSLDDFKGKTVVLYFYPRADTPGCTTQACGIRDDYSGFERKGAVVLGASPDTVEAQASFKAKYNLPFTLLADAEHKIAEQYGSWVLRERPTGEKFMGISRDTFIIGPNGTIQHVMRRVTPADHAKEVLATLG
jgi:peroxiredoxin Q/BCP